MHGANSRWWKLVGLTAVGVVAILGVGFFVQRVQMTRSKVQQTLCVHNLKMLDVATRRYADDHDGNFPGKISQLYPNNLPPADALVCPAIARHTNAREIEAMSAEELDSRSSYELVPGLRVGDDPDLVLAFEKGDHHGGRGHSVLYVDGRGGWDPPEAWRGKPKTTQDMEDK